MLLLNKALLWELWAASARLSRTWVQFCTGSRALLTESPHQTIRLQFSNEAQYGGPNIWYLGRQCSSSEVQAREKNGLWCLPQHTCNMQADTMDAKVLDILNNVKITTKYDVIWFIFYFWGQTETDNMSAANRKWDHDTVTVVKGKCFCLTLVAIARKHREVILRRRVRKLQIL